MPADIIPFSKWYSIKMKSERRASLDIRGTIGMSQEYREWGFEAAGTVLEFEKELKELGDVAVIDLNIYSLGGYVWDALAIHDILVRHPARIEAHVDGLAASAATIILMAADSIEIPSNAYLMIHNAAGCVCGDHRDMIKAAEMLRKFSGDIANMYAARIEGAKNETDRAALLIKLLKMMDEETWLTGEEAVELGLADLTGDVVEIAAFAGSMTNAAELSELINLSNAPDEIRNLFDTSEQTNREINHSENTPDLTMSTPAAPTAPPAQTPAPAAPAAAATAPVAPAAPTAQAPAAAPVPAPAAPAAAPVAEAPVAPVAAAPAAPVAPVAESPVVPPPAAGPVTMEAIAALITPIAEKVTALENAQTNQQNLQAAGVDPTAWGSNPPVPNVATGDPDSGPVNYEEIHPRALISQGRKAMHAKPSV